MIEKPEGTIRVATWNIKHGAPATGYFGNPGRVAEGCAELEADILALQEVDNGVLRSRHADIADIAAEFDAMDHRFEPTMQFRIGEYGNALLVRGEILDYEVLPLGEEKRYNRGIGKYVLRYATEPRNAIMARVKVAGREFSVGATHMSVGFHLRKEQISEVAAALSGMPPPRILLGDLNESGKNIQKRDLLGSLELVGHGPTFPAKEPRRDIDHIALDGLSVAAVHIKQLQVSDHQALIADVR